ncbi:MAG: cyclic nucleotide-binding domain-containing protein [candidate division Zixibacteria bacterium]|nr:cyclic nucleotide-binding domain-containing protein [candidate division Zixibacteria bacterium]
MESLEGILAEHPFLHGLSRPHLELIVGCATNVRFDPGQFLFHEGEEADRFYVIRHGKVRVELFTPGRGPITIQTVDDGDILGWSWLLAPYQWHFDAQAVELTRAIALDGECLRTKCERDHDLGYEMLKRFAQIMQQRMDATRLQLLDLYGNSR